MPFPYAAGAAGVLMACALALPVQAATFQTLRSDDSEVTFRYSQMGVQLDGAFRTVEGEVRFDSARPQDASVRLRIPLESVDTGSPEADDELQDVRWFDIDAHPAAEFRSTQIREQSNGVYDVDGVLAIKGREKPMSFQARLEQDGDQAHFVGSFPMKRADFAIGEGSWSSFDVVANEITVGFSIAVAP